MRVLLDTHAFLWWIAGDPRLSETARSVVRNRDNDILFSAAIGWEIAIKVGLGKLELLGDPERFIADQVARNGFKVLPIGLNHALRVHALPHHHRDPFDRMLVVQCQVEGLAIVSRDPYFAAYNVESIW